MKTIEKRLPLGKWRITLAPSDVGGHEIDGVALKGLRNRPFPIPKVSPAEFNKRHPFDESGPTDTDMHQRGIPSMWFNKGNQIYLFPAPAHDWTLQVRLRERI